MQIRSKILLDIGITCKSCFGYLPSCHVCLFSGISHIGKHDKCHRQCYYCGRQLPVFNDANCRLLIFQKWPLCVLHSSKNPPRSTNLQLIHATRIHLSAEDVLGVMQFLREGPRCYLSCITPLVPLSVPLFTADHQRGSNPVCQILLTFFPCSFVLTFRKLYLFCLFNPILLLLLHLFLYF